MILNRRGKNLQATGLKNYETRYSGYNQKVAEPVLLSWYLGSGRGAEKSIFSNS